MRKPVFILGISALYHDSAAALLRDGEIIAAAQEERFTRLKHDSNMPLHAINYCLQEASISAEELDHVVFYEKPLLKFDRLLETWFSSAPRGFGQFLDALPLWLKEKLHVPREIDKLLQKKYRGNYIFLEHHESHAASAFFPSPFESAAILTIDGVGEWTSASIGVGNGNKVELIKELRFPHSLGLLYSAFTYYTGFKVNSGEYKLMGLAPYGKPLYKDIILEKLLDLKEDGSFRLNMDYFAYHHSNRMISQAFADLFGGPPRKAEGALTQREMDIAASIQEVTEEIMLRMAHYAQRITEQDNLVLAGGVALNCVGNGRLLRESSFKNIWIQPAAGDAGSALGAALFVHYQLLENHRTILGNQDSQKGSLLGPTFSNEYIKNFLVAARADFTFYDQEEDLLSAVSALLADGAVVGWFQGRMEFGPRALGARSILGDARQREMQSKMNLKIKYRESFRPFAPSVLSDDTENYFAMSAESPYMLLVTEIQDSQKLPETVDSVNLQGIDLLKHPRSLIPGVTHVDYSARVQSVDEKRNPRYYRLLKKFKQETSCSLLINTSFNIRGEPIVCTPQDAYRCFLATQMDALVLENILLLREKQPKENIQDYADYFSTFELD
jgi:carbamoyltransferase